MQKVQEGMEGKNSGLSSGLKKLDSCTNSIQKESIDVWGGRPKSNKTTIVDYRYILSVYYPGITNIRWIYLSYEISIDQKIAKFVAYFMKKKHNIRCSASYILSKGTNRLSEAHKTLVDNIYENEIKELFGEFDEMGRQTKEGLIIFIEQRENPTGIRNYLMRYAETTGQFIKEKYKVFIDGTQVTKQKIVGYRQTNEDLHTIILLDHVGKIPGERGFTKKENIDKLSEYAVELRNMCKWTFVFVSQFNRGLGAIDRLKFSGNDLEPTIEDFKDTGNLAEDANLVFVIFNPSEYNHLAGEEYNGYKLNILGKHFRSIKLLLSRDTDSNIALGVVVNGGNGDARELPNPTTEKHELQQIYNTFQKS
ncbi:MAG TPA: DnaB-like helicase C-terminal domain-containing protein [Burkholderiales bacterium]|nr:DnaB-like helicase C-terminal domain-containing protein [Burkholderiales bacterium]